MKDKIRKEILIKREQISKEAKSLKDEKIRQNLFSITEFVEAIRICIYASFKSEVNTFSIITYLISIGKKVILPKVEKKEHKLYLYEIEDINDLQPGFMGIYEPSEKNRRVEINNVDLVIVPGVCFDIYGNRIGYGGGYYDILLTNREMNTPIIALAYEEQIIPKIQSEPHDIRVDIIITEKRIIKINENK